MNRRFIHACWLAAAIFTVTQAQPAAAETVLVHDGQPRAVIVLPAEPQPHETRAAEELVEHIKLISGAELETAAAAGEVPGLTPIYLGAAADATLDERTRHAGDNPSSFTLRVQHNRIDIRGLSDEGTLFGTYELLEQLGVRWYMPGDIGRVLPETTSLRIDAQTTTQAPSMDWRMLQPWEVHSTPWNSRMRLGGAERSTGAHNIRPFGGGATGRRHFQENPELYGLVDGERRHRQVCVSNPQVLELAVEDLRARLQADPSLKYVGMGPNDGGGYCECDNCRALDRGVYDPVSNNESMTDRYIWFFNQILERLEDEHPDLRIVWYVYAAHMMPPAIEMHPRIVNVIAPIGLDRFRGMDNPMSPDRHVLRWLVDEWRSRGPNEIYYRGYYNNLACVQLPKTQIDQVRNEIPALHQQGVNVMRVEVIRQSWASDPVTLWLASKVMWNVEADVDALLDEFYEKFYGPAEAPMRAYHEQLEAAFRDTPYLTGSSYIYFPIFMDHPRRDELRSLLDEAVSLAPAGSVYHERLEILRQGYHRMDLFLDMMLARNRHDFATAATLMREYDELTDALAGRVLEGEGRWAHRLVNVAERTANPRSYFNRFFRKPIEAGIHRVVEQGEIVAPLADEWLFLLDPAEIGQMSNYQRPGVLGGNWRPMLTSSRSWSDQGLHYYKGAAWYRQRVHIPAEFEGRRIYLWFGGVDRVAHVWINGQFVGTNREPAEGLPGVPGTFAPFDMPATKAVKFGQDNWVVVMIESRTGLAEVGTGGIVAPVMFWSPDSADWQP